MRLRKQAPTIEDAFTTGKEEIVERTYRLLTPLFGGGVASPKADPVTVVRPSGIKGQLRFWWRAVMGWQAKGDLERLLGLEELVWGGVTKLQRSSLVSLQVEILDKGKEAKPFTRQPGRNFPRNHPDVAPAYVAFPLQGARANSTDHTEPTVLQGVRFRLELRYPGAFPKQALDAFRSKFRFEPEVELNEQVTAALWAWETFGGVGGRTRRGFGALSREDQKTPPKTGDIRASLQHYTRGNASEAWPQGVPHLTEESELLLLNCTWREVIDHYRRFRQWREHNHIPRDPGRSLWPEPDEIRRIANTHSIGHEPRIPVHKFPRGRFGLPIIFHFKDREEPQDSTLKGRKYERLASPLVFRPLGPNGPRPVLVYVLRGSEQLPEGYGLELQGELHPVEVQLTPEEAELIEPLRQKGIEKQHRTNPVLAFIDWLKGGCEQ